MTKGKEKGRSNAPPRTNTLYNMCPIEPQVVIALRFSTAELFWAST